MVGDDGAAGDFTNLLDPSGARVHERAQLAVAFLGEFEGCIAGAEGVVALALHAQGSLEGAIALFLEALHGVVGWKAYVVLLECGLEVGQEGGDGRGAAGDGHRLLRGCRRSGGGMALMEAGIAAARSVGRMVVLLYLLLLLLLLLLLFLLALLVLLLLLVLALLLLEVRRRHIPIAPECRLGDYCRSRLERVMVEYGRLRAVSISDQRRRVVLLSF